MVLIAVGQVACSRAPEPSSSASPSGRGQQAPESLPAVVLPDLASVAAPVRQQITTANDSLTAALSNSASSVADRAQRYGDFGNVLLASTFFDEAVLCYRHAEALQPADARWPYFRGHASLKKGDREDAARAFERTLSIDSRYLPAVVWLGDTYLDLGRVGEAQAAFARALALQPDSAAALFGAGRAALARQAYGDAIGHLEHALQVDPRATVINYPLAMAYRGNGQRAKADALLQRRGNVAPDLLDPLLQQADVVLESAVSYEGLGMQALRRQDWAGAVQAFRRGLDIAPDDASLRYWMATAMIASGDAAGAEREFREVVRRAPGFANAHFSLGAILDRRGQKAEALREYQAAVDAAPNMPEARLRLAETLRAQGQLRPAIAQYEEAVKLDPTVAEAWIGGAQALIAAGRTAEARAWIARGRAIHPQRRELSALQAQVGR
jgi:tetratricopeptide (TPR) repeat protein